MCKTSSILNICHFKNSNLFVRVGELVNKYCKKVSPIMNN